MPQVLVASLLVVLTVVLLCSSSRLASEGPVGAGTPTTAAVTVEHLGTAAALATRSAVTAPTQFAGKLAARDWLLAVAVIGVLLAALHPRRSWHAPALLAFPPSGAPVIVPRRRGPPAG